MKLLKPNPSGLSGLTKLNLCLAGVALIISIFVPIWRIDLDAPQYPEGLMLQIFSYKLGGNVEIINGLNHYIGMKTLHAEEFVEFTVLPYIIGFFALLSMGVALISSRKLLYVLFSLFVLFGIVAMYDFWHWEYEYGHNLDPNAAIIVPGMAYQPPLIGFKQLLNFGAYSIPDLGGWLFIVAGVLMMVSVFMEWKWSKKSAMQISALLFAVSVFSSCAPDGPVPVKLHEEECAHCKMTISDIRFASELLTSKGRIYKFDDITCLTGYMKEHATAADDRFYISSYSGDGTFLEAEKAFYIKSEQLKSPMRGNIAAFPDANAAQLVADAMQAEATTWNEIIKP